MSSCMLVILLYFTVSLSGSVYASSATGSAQALSPQGFKRVCSAATPGHAACLALFSQAPVAAPAKGQAGANPLASAPGGSHPYSPANLHNAYNLPTTSTRTQTVAIVDAYNDPNAESDLATYRSNWGIPACTTANGCFRKVNQTGGTSYPTSNASWGEEISLDLDMVSAICYNCHILLVEANSTSLSDLGTAANTAASLGANEISNSYGTTGEISGESSMCNSYYNHSNVAVTASTGDEGPSVDFPAVCPHVVGVGGTTLNTTGTETAWSGAGGGCSSQITKPSWESSSVTGCSRRATADVSAVADPNTGVYVYDTYGVSGWFNVGGTSASSPIIAAVYGLAGGVSGDAASVPWSHYTSGCLYKVGGATYAYQTGLGSPHGIACF